MEQIDMFSQQKQSQERAEKIFYQEEILPLFRKIQEERSISMDDVHFKECASYYSLYFKTFLAFQLKLGKSKSYIAAPSSIVKELPPDESYYQIPSNRDFTRIPLESAHLSEAQLDAIHGIILSTIDRCQKEFDCCSRYEACSDAKHCIHPDRKFSIGCGYRKILESGIVFYGKNRNID